MSPKSVLSRVTLVAALAISAVALGGCAETTAGHAGSPVADHMPGAGYRLMPPVVGVRNESGPTSTYAVASSRSSRADVARSDRSARGAH
jgi:hypothetical protein